MLQYILQFAGQYIGILILAFIVLVMFFLINAICEQLGIPLSETIKKAFVTKLIEQII